MQEAQSDVQLVDETRLGNRHSFAELFRRYQTRIRNVLARCHRNDADVEDLVQETFLSAYRSLNTYRAEANFYTWLYQIAFRVFLAFKRKKSQRMELSGQFSRDELTVDFPAIRSRESPILTDLVRQENHRGVHRAIDNLEADDRQVILLKHIEGKDYSTIASLLKVPIGTIRSRLFRARSKLRQTLDPSAW